MLMHFKLFGVTLMFHSHLFSAIHHNICNNQVLEYHLTLVHVSSTLKIYEFKNVSRDR